MKQILIDTLMEPEQLVAYSLSNGENGLDVIKDKVGKSRATVSRYWDVWKKVGIVESIDVKGGTRARALFNLDEFGIDVPELVLEKKANFEPEPEMKPNE